jgi:hypothetical protein
MDVRQEVLRRLLVLQEELGQELISVPEITLIHQIWVSDKLVPSRIDLGADGSLAIDEPDFLEVAVV